jgi:hypothetical protein
MIEGQVSDSIHVEEALDLSPSVIDRADESKSI